MGHQAISSICVTSAVHLPTETPRESQAGPRVPRLRLPERGREIPLKAPSLERDLEGRAPKRAGAEPAHPAPGVAQPVVAEVEEAGEQPGAAQTGILLRPEEALALRASRREHEQLQATTEKARSKHLQHALYKKRFFRRVARNSPRVVLTEQGDWVQATRKKTVKVRSADGSSWTTGEVLVPVLSKREKRRKLVARYNARVGHAFHALRQSIKRGTGYRDDSRYVTDVEGHDANPFRHPAFDIAVFGLATGASAGLAPAAATPGSPEAAFRTTYETIVAASLVDAQDDVQAASRRLSTQATAQTTLLTTHAKAREALAKVGFAELSEEDADAYIANFKARMSDPESCKAICERAREHDSRHLDSARMLVGSDLSRKAVWERDVTSAALSAPVNGILRPALAHVSTVPAADFMSFAGCMSFGMSLFSGVFDIVASKIALDVANAGQAQVERRRDAMLALPTASQLAEGLSWAGTEEEAANDKALYEALRKGFVDDLEKRLDIAKQNVTFAEIGIARGAGFIVQGTASATATAVTLAGGAAVVGAAGAATLGVLPVAAAGVVLTGTLAFLAYAHHVMHEREHAAKWDARVGRGLAASLPEEEFLEAVRNNSPLQTVLQLGDYEAQAPDGRIFAGEKPIQVNAAENTPMLMLALARRLLHGGPNTEHFLGLLDSLGIDPVMRAMHEAKVKAHLGRHDKPAAEAEIAGMVADALGAAPMTETLHPSWFFGAYEAARQRALADTRAQEAPLPHLIHAELVQAGVDMKQFASAMQSLEDISRQAVHGEGQSGLVKEMVEVGKIARSLARAVAS